jgi:hypothetical protein
MVPHNYADDLLATIRHKSAVKSVNQLLNSPPLRSSLLRNKRIARIRAPIPIAKFSSNNRKCDTGLYE